MTGAALFGFAKGAPPTVPLEEALPDTVGPFSWESVNGTWTAVGP